jgi:hypothetical protein
VVEHEFGDHAQAAAVRFLHKLPKIGQRPVVGMDPGKVGDVVAVVLEGGGIERQQPQAGDAEVVQIIQLRRQAAKIPPAIPVTVGKGPDVQLVEDGVFIPIRIRCLHRCVLPWGETDAPRVSSSASVSALAPWAGDGPPRGAFASPLESTCQSIAVVHS